MHRVRSAHRSLEAGESGEVRRSRTNDGGEGFGLNWREEEPHAGRPRGSHSQGVTGDSDVLREGGASMGGRPLKAKQRRLHF